MPWTQATDPASGAPYWWSEEGEVTWLDPSASQSTALPSGWTSLLDPSTGAQYWWHAKTGARQWERPAEVGEEGGEEGKEEDREGERGRPPAQAAPLAVDEPQPFDAISPALVSAPHSDGLPAAPAAAREEGGVLGFGEIFGASASAAERSEKAASALPSALLQRLAKRGILGGGANPPSSAPSAPSAPLPSAAPARLPPGWVARRDPSGSVFYVHTTTNQTSWEIPTYHTSCLTRAPSAPSAPPTVSEQAGAGEGLSEKEITALVLARGKAKQAKDYSTADTLLRELRSHGVSVDDQVGRESGGAIA